MHKEIGGYFNLELKSNGTFLCSDGILLNSGRNALEFILLSLKDIRHIWIPFFTCEVILDPLVKMGISYSFYSINEKLEIVGDLILKKGDYVLYTNYFGIKDAYIKNIVELYGKYLIIDNAQAYYSKPILGVSTFYSPRKFVGVPDGGIAYINNSFDFNQYFLDKSYNRCAHLLKRYDEKASFAYNDFKDNEDKLKGQDIKLMSYLTRAILSNVNFEEVKKIRIRNFFQLNKKLKHINEIPLDMSYVECPMIYPILTNDRRLRKRLIDNKIYVATYWPNVFQTCDKDSFDYKMSDELIPLPIDQRYGEDEMNYIIKIINNGRI